MHEMQSRMTKKLKSICLVASMLFANSAWSDSGEFSGLAENFLSSARSGKLANVDEFISPQWLQVIKPDEFERFLDVFGLDDYQRVIWGESSSEGNTGELKGEFIGADAKFPIVLAFLKHEGKWLLNGITVLPNKPPVVLPEPDYETTLALVQKTMADFSNAVNKKDMKLFHATGSTSFRIRHGSDELQEVFAQYFDTGDFSQRFSTIPELAKPTYEEGYLKVLGGLEAAGYTTRFEIEYVSEKSEWRVTSFGIASNPLEAK